MKQIIYAILLLFSIQSFSQEKPVIKTRLDVSYILGAQVYNDLFLYNPGYSTQLTTSLQLQKTFDVGIGAGYTQLSNERFVPIYIEAIGYKKKKENSPAIKFQLGYSLGWSTLATNQENFDMNGGLYFNAGIGRKFAVNDQFSVLFHWSYSHQFAKMKYTVFESKPYSEVLSFEMLQLSIGVILH